MSTYIVKLSPASVTREHNCDRLFTNIKYIVDGNNLRAEGPHDSKSFSLKRVGGHEKITGFAEYLDARLMTIVVRSGYYIYFSNHSEIVKNVPDNASFVRFWYIYDNINVQNNHLVLSSRLCIIEKHGGHLVGNSYATKYLEQDKAIKIPLRCGVYARCCLGTISVKERVYLEL